jgi:hypothetical protein
MAETLDEDLRRRIAAAYESHPDLKLLSQIKVQDLIALIRAQDQGEGYLAEVGRRHIKALEDTSKKLYRLTFVIGLYSVALLVFAVLGYLTLRR